MNTLNTFNIPQTVGKVKFVPTKIDKKQKVGVSVSSPLLARNLRTAKRQAENSKLLASRLKVANENESDIYQLVLADLLELEADDKANGVLHNFKDAQGREFSCAIGAQFSYSRLSDSYQRKQTARQRKRLQVAFIEKLDFIQKNNLEVCFFTPTYPNLLGVGFEKNSEFHAKSWELFLRDKFIRKMFLGGYSRTEFTAGKKKERLETGASFDLNVHGLNFHNHALVILKKALEFSNSHQLENKLEAIRSGEITVSKEEKRLLGRSLKIVRKWTKCLKVAHKQVFKKCLKIKTISGNSKVDFKKVDVKEIKNHSNKERKGVLFEICGYISKQADFESLSPELLSEAEEVFRHKRVLVPFGCFKQRLPDFHFFYAFLSVWTDSGKQEQPKENLPEKELLDVADPSLKQDTCRLKSGSESEAKFLCYQRFADTKKSLKKIGIEMCEAGKRNDWLVHLGKIRNYLITKHRNSLLSRFPDAIFTDLTGQRYYGRNLDPLLGGKGTKKKLYEPLGEADAVTYSVTTEQIRRPKVKGGFVITH
jgi:hypothetical protein